MQVHRSAGARVDQTSARFISLELADNRGEPHKVAVSKPSPFSGGRNLNRVGSKVCIKEKRNHYVQDSFFLKSAVRCRILKALVNIEDGLKCRHLSFAHALAGRDIK